MSRMILANRNQRTQKNLLFTTGGRGRTMEICPRRDAARAMPFRTVMTGQELNGPDVALLLLLYDCVPLQVNKTAKGLWSCTDPLSRGLSRDQDAMGFSDGACLLTASCPDGTRPPS